MEKKHINTTVILMAIIVGVVIGSTFSYYMHRSYNSYHKVNIYDIYRPSTTLIIDNFKYVEMKLPAVYEINSTGVYALAKMYITKGHGNIFIHVNNILYGETTEHSIRKAIKYALKHENISEDIYDFYVSIDSQANVLTGPSAGAAFTLMALALLQNKSINESVMITGTILHDGRIGVSGKIKEKAIAAKEAGATLFLVPEGLSKEYNIEQEEYCDTWDGKEYCEVEEYANITDIQQLTGIKIIEVKTVDEAAKYILS